MMADHTYLITGANRGIGLAITSILIQRPHATVIATIRTSSTSTTELSGLPIAETSKLIILPLDFSEPSQSKEAFDTFANNLTATHGITRINTIIANAGIGTSFLSAKDTPLASLSEHYKTNTLGPILLYQTLYPLLITGSGEGSDGKFILISSSLGSIEAMEGAVPSLAYGVSKAAANYFIRKIHFEESQIAALAIHPGWVKTGNGQAFADSIGVEEPPMSVEESARGVLDVIDNATKGTTSGGFLSYDGSVLPW